MAKFNMNVFLPSVVEVAPSSSVRSSDGFFAVTFPIVRRILWCLVVCALGLPAYGTVQRPLIVTTQESGLQSVEAVERYARRIPVSRVIVLPGDSYHIAAVEPNLCARHALEFMQQADAMRARAAE